MKTETTQITKLLISDLLAEPHKLDPVTVILEDLGLRAEIGDHKTRQGKIIIECYGRSWSYYWGSMGDCTVAQFFADSSVDYIADCLKRGADMDSSVFSGEALDKAVRRAVIECRRGRETQRYECGRLDKHGARELYDMAGELRNFEGAEALMYSKGASDLLATLFSDEWHHSVSDLAFVPSPDYRYLLRIVLATQEGLRLAGLAKGKVAA